MRLEASWVGLVSYKRDPRGLSSFLSITLGHSEKWAVCTPGEGSHQTPTELVPRSQTSSLPNCQKYISVV